MHRQATAEGLIPLSVGYPSAKLFPATEIGDAIAATLRDEPERALQYSDIQGVPELADQLARLSTERGAPEDPDDILITTGASQALAARLPGDPAPRRRRRLRGPQLHLGDPLDARQRRPRRRRSRATTTAWTSMRSRRCSPARRSGCSRSSRACHNPTGRDLARARRERLLELARRHGFFILEDGIYGDLRFAGDDPRSLRSEAPAHVIYVDSFSKTLGGGLRIGWVAASGPVLDRIIAAKRSDDIHSPTLTQLAVARYLATGAYPGADRARRRLLSRAPRRRCRSSIERHLGSVATYTEPLGGGHLWLDLDLDLDERELADEAIREGVAYVPGAALRTESSARPTHAALVRLPRRARDRRGPAADRQAITSLRARPARRQAVPV